MNMKVCSTCKEEKYLTEFYSNGYQPSGTKKYKAKCKKCTAKYDMLSLIEKITNILKEVGQKYKCEICGYDKNYSALTFHHLDPEEKDFSISDSKTISVTKLRNEISKCVVLCSNCHAEEHNPHLDKTIIVDRT